MIHGTRSDGEAAEHYCQRVLDHFERFPDAPSAIPMYLRAILEIAVAQERRDLEEAPLSDILA